MPCQLSSVAKITYSTPCAVDSRLLTPWWGMVESESTTDRDVFSLLPPSLIFPDLSLPCFIHVLEDLLLLLLHTIQCAYYY